MKERKPPRDRGARFLLVAASLVLVVGGMRAVKSVALPILVAVFLSILSAPLLSWLQRHRVPRAIAVVVTVLANVSVMAVLLVMIGGSINEFAKSIPGYQASLEAKAEEFLEHLEEWGVDTTELDWLKAEIPEGPLFGDGLSIDGEIPDQPPPSVSPRGDISPSDLISWSWLFDLIGATLSSIASILSMTLIVFLLMVFILFEAAALPLKLKQAFGWSDYDLNRFTREIQRYLVIKTLISVMTGVLVFLGIWALGVKYPLLWALSAFLLNYIPSIGSIIAAVPPVILTWIDLGLGRAVLVGLVFLVVNVFLGNLLEPHLMGRRFGISTLVVILSLIFWGWLWGPVGMLLSVPLTVILKVVLENTEDFRWLAQLIGAAPRPPAEPSTAGLEEAPLAGSAEG